MAQVTGFRGLLYDPSKVKMDDVLAPPYDVIDSAGRENLTRQSSHNCVKVIIPDPSEVTDKKYSDAKSLLDSWTRDGTLVQDDAPALYRYHQVFTRVELGSEPVTRRGFIAAVRLHDFDEGVILRHERTLKGPKIDRLKLWETTETHLSQIFTLYSDPKAEVDAQFHESESQAPLIEGTTADGTCHRLWRVSDADTMAKVSALMKDKNLYIADGHHRYETMLALRNKMLEANPNCAPQSAAHFGMMFLANIDDPGLIVLPTHRMIHSLTDFDPIKLKVALAEFFIMTEVADSSPDAKTVLAHLEASSQQGTSFAYILPGEHKVTLLRLRPEIDLLALGLKGSQATLALDVTILHELVFEKIMGIDRAAQEAQAHIYYIKDTGKALDRNAGGEGQICFLMNPTKVSQVVAVSDAGEVMPQKSTFFYPKIASGMVFNPIDVAETL